MFLTPSPKLHWTYHAQDKMRFYRLSEARVKRVLNSPKRVEEGVAPNTVAMMQPSSVKRVMGPAFVKTTVGRQESSNEKRETWTQEIWVMAQKVSGVKGPSSAKATAGRQGPRVKIISAWRYPGMSKARSEIIKNFIRQEYKESIR